MPNGAVSIAGREPEQFAEDRGQFDPNVTARLAVFLDENYGKPISVGDLAELVGLTRSRFTERFARTFGRPPHQYILNLRIIRAKQLLEASNLPIADVAASTGFNSQSHMTSVFRRLRGTTPRQIRLKSL